MYIYTPFRLCSFALCEVELFANGAGGRRKSNDDVHLQMRPATGRSALFLLSLLAAEAATAESPSSVCCLRMRFPFPLIIYVYAFCSRARAHIRGGAKDTQSGRLDAPGDERASGPERDDDDASLERRRARIDWICARAYRYIYLHLRVCGMQAWYVWARKKYI